jgi:hypothetical protein
MVGHTMSFIDLPSEIYYIILYFLDDVDKISLTSVNRRLYRLDHIELRNYYYNRPVPSKYIRNPKAPLVEGISCIGPEQFETIPTDRYPDIRILHIGHVDRGIHDIRKFCIWRIGIELRLF